MAHRRIPRALLSVFLTLGLAAQSLPVWSATGTSLGTAVGIRAVELSLDGGKMWMPLDGRSLPILEAADIRSASGSAVLDLTDGSRLTVQPFTSVRIRPNGTAIDVVLDLGRVGFRLPAGARVAIATASARLRTPPTEAVAGEVVVVAGGVVGVRLMQGRATVQELVGAKRTVLATLEPVFLPTRPEGAEQVFGDTKAASQGGRAAFAPNGASLGYLNERAGLVVEPGYTRDLTSPFPAKLVQAVTARIPEPVRKEAVPVFDVNGNWLGYLVGPTFHGRDQALSGLGAGSGGGGATWAMAGAGISALAAAGGGTKIVAKARTKPRPSSAYKPK